MISFRRIFLISLLFFCLCEAQSQGDNVTDSGFRPEVNGFSFENYGNEKSPSGLSEKEMVRLFGQKVCSSSENGKCVLAPPAKAWMQEANKAMDVGHCEGMAVLSSLLYYNKIFSGRFKGRYAVNLSFENEMLQREIAYWWVTQFTTPARMEIVSDSANAVIDTLAKSFEGGKASKQWWTMGLYLPDRSGGHAITPYALQNLNSTTSLIWVYDNNIPKRSRSIEVNRTTNTWKYDASTKPGQASELYIGNATTKTMEIVSIPPRLKLQKCDFCGSILENGTKNAKGGLRGKLPTQFWADGHARLLITDENGSKLGYVDPIRFISEIPDADAINPLFGNIPWSIKHEPILMAPLQNWFSALLTEYNLPGTSTLTVISSYYYVRLSDVTLDKDESIQLTVEQKENDLIARFTGSEYESPKTVTLSMGVRTPTKSYELETISIDLDPQGSLIFHYDPDENTLQIENDGNNEPGKLYFGILAAMNAAGSWRFHNKDLLFGPGTKMTLFLNSYNGNCIECEVDDGVEVKRIELCDDLALHPEGEKTYAETEYRISRGGTTFGTEKPGNGDPGFKIKIEFGLSLI